MPKVTEPIKKIQHKDGTVRWRFRADMGRDVSGKRIQQWRTFNTLKEARDEWNRIQVAKADGVQVVPRKLTVDTYLGQWLEGKRNLKPGTRRTYEDNLKHVRERLGEVEVQKLTVAQLDKLITWMLTSGRRVGNVKRQAISAATVCRTLTVLSQALDAAMRQGIVARNVASLIERPRHTNTETMTWTGTQAAKFLSSVSEDRLYAGWLMSLCGLRRGEVLGLRWSDIDFVKKTLTISNVRSYVAGIIIEDEPKTERSKRTLPLDAKLLQALEALRVRQMDQSMNADEAYEPECPLCLEPHVIVDELGRPYRPQWYGDRFQALSKLVGMPVIRLHDARHTCGTLMHLRGVPVAVISAWLGHASAAFTMSRYVHSQDPALLEAGEAHVRAITG